MSKIVKLKEVVETKNESGESIKLAVVMPSGDVLTEGDRVYTKEFMVAFKGGAPLRSKIRKMLKEQNIWDDDKQAELDSIDKVIADGEKSLLKGGIRKSEARQVAINIRKKRIERLNLLSSQNELDNMTCEAIAENKRFDFFVSKCVVDPDNGEHYYKDLEDYNERSSEQVARDCATKLAMLVYGVDPDFQKSLVENKFLLKYGFVNEDLHLIDDQGRLCDENFRLVREDGRYIDSDGNLIDINGNRVNEDGSPYVEFQEFLD